MIKVNILNLLRNMINIVYSSQELRLKISFNQSKLKGINGSIWLISINIEMLFSANQVSYDINT